MEKEVKEAKEEKAGKEKSNKFRLFMQYLLSPVIIIIIGFYFNVQLERTKQSFQTLELELKRIQAAQQMLEELFSGTPERAFIAERLIAQIVDEKLSKEISELVQNYYKEELDESLFPQDISKINEISKAALRVGSPTGKALVKAYKESRYHIVAGSYPDKEKAVTVRDAGFISA